MIHARPRFCSYSMTPAGDDFVPIQPFGRPGGLFLAQAAALERAESEKDSSDKSPGHGALQGCAGEGRRRGPRRPGCPPEDRGAGGSKPPTCSVDVVAWRVRRASNGAIAPRHAGATASPDMYELVGTSGELSSYLEVQMVLGPMTADAGASLWHASEVLVPCEPALASGHNRSANPQKPTR